MKNKLLSSALILIVTIVGTLNVNFTSLENDDVFTLEMEMKTASANTEWNNWTQWLSQGFTQDEEEMEESCPSSSGSSVTICVNKDSNGVCLEYTTQQVNPINRNDIRCGFGSVNCTRVTCG